jgi:uncharacterized membrane protein
MLPALILAATPAAAAKEAPAVPVQLLQPGDGQLSCQALATQINQLASAEAQPAKPKKKGFGFGALTKVLGAAAPVLGGMGGSGMGGMLAGQAMGALQGSAAENQMNAQMEAATAAAMPVAQSVEAQRKARLMGFFTEKGC